MTSARAVTAGQELRWTGTSIEENIRWKETLGREWRQYERIFSALNESRIDQVSLECADSKVPLPRIGWLGDKAVMVGAIIVATLEIETPETVAETIKNAMRYVDPERMYPCTNRGMAPRPRSVARGKLEARSPGRRWCAASSGSAEWQRLTSCAVLHAVAGSATRGF